MENPSPARDDVDALGTEPDGGYAGPPGRYQPALDGRHRQNKRAGQILSAVGSLLHILGGAVADHYGAQAAELVQQAHRDGHRQGWYERGEELVGVVFPEGSDALIPGAADVLRPAPKPVKDAPQA